MAIIIKEKTNLADFCIFFLYSQGLLTEGFFWIPSLGGPTTIAARQSGSGISWLFPFVVRCSSDFMTCEANNWYTANFSAP